MKSITLVIFLFIVSYSSVNAQEQSEILIATGDSSEVVYIPGGVRTGFLTISDSTMAGVDTIYVVVKTGSAIPQYSPLGMHDLNATASTTYLAQPLIPGTGVARTYSFDCLQTPGGTLVIYRSNIGTTGVYAPKTRIVLSWK